MQHFDNVIEWSNFLHKQLKSRSCGALDFTALADLYGKLEVPEYPDLKSDAQGILLTIWSEICHYYQRSGKLTDFSMDSPSALLFDTDSRILIDNVMIAYGNPHLRASLIALFFASPSVSSAIIDFCNANHSKRIDWNESPAFQDLIISLATKAAECGLSRILDAQSISGIFDIEKHMSAAEDFPKQDAWTLPQIDHYRRWNHSISVDGSRQQPDLVPLDFDPKSNDNTQNDVLDHVSTRDYLDTLSDKDRHIIEMYALGFSPEKIASEVGYSSASSVCRRRAKIAEKALIYGIKPTP